MCHNTYVYMVYHRLIYGVVSMVFYVSNLTTTHCQHIVRSLAVFFRGLKLTLEYIFKSALSRILYQYSLWVFYITPFILILYQVFCHLNIPRKYLGTIYWFKKPIELCIVEMFCTPRWMYFFKLT